jgi:hypothetical protein
MMGTWILEDLKNILNLLMMPMLSTPQVNITFDIQTNQGPLYRIKNRANFTGGSGGLSSILLSPNSQSAEIKTPIHPPNYNPADGTTWGGVLPNPLNQQRHVQSFYHQGNRAEQSSWVLVHDWGITDATYKFAIGPYTRSFLSGTLQADGVQTGTPLEFESYMFLLDYSVPGGYQYRGPSTPGV